MKAYLVVPLVGLLALGPGCSGQKADETGEADMSQDLAAAEDLSAPPDLASAGPDLKQLTCGDVAACFLTCLSSGKSTCQTDCTKNASTDAQTKFGLLALCIALACPAVGANAPCATQSSPTCIACATKALQSGGACHSQAQACGL